MSSFHQILSEAKSRIQETDAPGSIALISQGYMILDVREPEEYEQGSVPNALHIPRGILESNIENHIPDYGQPIIVMCASGVRSVFATETLNQMGYSTVVSMDGGFNQWKQMGYECQMPHTLDPEQRNRYQRHLQLPEVGEEGQLSLLDAKVLLLGAGGLGSPAAMYLAAAGIGTLGIIDMDVVDESNLQRQILHNIERVGARKVDSAKETINSLNPDVNVVAYDARLSSENILDILEGYDVVVDGADNFPSRYLLNDASVKLGIPVVHGSIFRFEGQVTVFDPRDGVTYRDMQPETPSENIVPNCAEAGVLGVLPGIVGSIQALETIKLILNIGENLSGRLVVFDSLEMTFHEYEIKKDPDNKITWENRHLIEITEIGEDCASQVESQTPTEN
ncbi:MAG: molybdopterin biosynthesis protein MoeB [marine actinobacterium MedAcidi-G2B]|nr:MAG: molybdopterin biosynthesis protein MoeB [marine actinobacterium MedAcidi-G2B]|tara:strand:+ start:8088 stop:9269 length:1182 start_codon:yes stop_codon:yes gene_type:complete